MSALWPGSKLSSLYRWNIFCEFFVPETHIHRRNGTWLLNDDLAGYVVFAKADYMTHMMDAYRNKSISYLMWFRDLSWHRVKLVMHFNIPILNVFIKPLAFFPPEFSLKAINSSRFVLRVSPFQPIRFHLSFFFGWLENRLTVYSVFNGTFSLWGGKG